MKKYSNPIINFVYLAYRMIEPVMCPIRFFRGIKNYLSFCKDFFRLKAQGGMEVNYGDLYPCLHDKTSSTPYDPHYFFQGHWAAGKILQVKSDKHVDVGSSIIFVGQLSASISVEFIDIRPLETGLENLILKAGSVLALPYKDQSISSLSCLHVVEHVGLGRYGDPVDAEGSIKACQELARVVKPGGNLFFSTPIGRDRVCFNAHRVFDPQVILEYFQDLELVEFSCVNDSGEYLPGVDVSNFIHSDYACGMYHFKRKLMQNYSAGQLN